MQQGQYYFEYDAASASYCVFHTDKGEGKAYSSWATPEQAERDSSKRNEAETIGAVAEGTAFTIAELRRYFEMVQNKTDWKLPVDAEVSGLAPRDIIGLREAVVFYTGTKATVRQKGTTVHVRAAGYYNMGVENE